MTAYTSIYNTPPSGTNFLIGDTVTLTGGDVWKYAGDGKWAADQSGSVKVTVDTVTGGMTIYGADGAAVLEIPKSGYENKLVATDYLPYLYFSENATYKFGKRNGTGADITFYKVKKSDSVASDGLAITSLYIDDGVTLITTGSISNVWAWDDYQLAQVNDLSTNQNYLYKSIDGFVTCGSNAPLYNDNKPVFAIGWNVAKSTKASAVTIMAQWALCRGTNRRGEDLLVFGQYNVNGARTAGGDNDWANLICSRQGGDLNTFEVVVELNTNGTNYLRHCHAVMQDPYTKEFWVMYGDDAKCGIYVWDGVYPLPANTPPSQCVAYQGWRGIDKNNVPGGDFNLAQGTVALFLPSEVIMPLDIPSYGVVSLSRDLSSITRLANGSDMNIPQYHSLYSACIDPVSGAAIVSTIIEPNGLGATSDYVLWVWTATKAENYRDWKRVARYMVATDRTGGREHEVMQANADGTIYIGSSNGAGKDYHSTAVCRISGVYSEAEEAVIHPVFWVDPVFGNDANTGYSTGQKWKSLNYALRGNRVCLSSLVNVAGGYSNEGAASYTLSFNITNRQAQTNYPVIIRGSGRKKTVVYGATANPVFGQSTTPAIIRWESLSLVNTTTGGSVWTNGSTASANNDVEFKDVYIKGASLAIYQPTGKLKLSQFECDLSFTTSQLVRADYAATLTTIVQSGVCRSGKYMVGWVGDASSSCRVENVTGIGQSQSGVCALAAAVNLPIVKNIAVDAAVPVVQDQRTVKTSADGIVEYNVGRSASTGLVGGDAGSKTVASLGLIGTTGMPAVGSALIGAGTISVDAIKNIAGDMFASSRNVGAF